MKIKFVFIAILLALTLFVAFGFASLLFNKTNGVILSFNKLEMPGAAYPVSNGKRTFDGGEKTVSKVRFQYSVNSTNHVGNLCCFWVTHEPKLTYQVGQKVDVFYFPLWPELAVLHPGPDLLLMLIVLGLLFSYFLIYWFLRTNPINKF